MQRDHYTITNKQDTNVLASARKAIVTYILSSFFIIHTHDMDLVSRTQRYSFFITPKATKLNTPHTKITKYTVQEL